MKCDCADCGFRGMELCEHRKLMDAVNARNKVILALCNIIKDAMGYIGAADCHDLCGTADRMKCLARAPMHCLILKQWGEAIDNAKELMSCGAN